MPTNFRSSRERYRIFTREYTDKLAEHAKARHRPAWKERLFAKVGLFRQCANCLERYRWPVVALLGLALLRTILQMVEPLFMRYIVDHALLQPGLEQTARLTRVNIAGLLFLLLIVVSTAVGAFKEYYQQLVYARLTLHLQRSMFARLMELPLIRLSEMKGGGILSRLSGDVETGAGLVQLIVSPIVSLLGLVIAIAVLLWMNWRLALIIIPLLGGVGIVSLLNIRRIRPIHRALRADAERVNARAGEAFEGIRVVRTFRRELSERLEYTQGRQAMLRKEVFAQHQSTMIWTLWRLMMGCVSVGVSWYGARLRIGGGASIGDIMAVQWYTLLLLTPAWGVVSSFSELQRSLASMERVLDVLRMARDKPDRIDAKDTPAAVDEVSFENVEFEYRQGYPVIRDISFRAPSGSVVALVGRSGAGKTTIVDLVARFHDPTKGRILLNGKDIREYRLRAYRGLLATVQQNTFLFAGSVRDNIAYGRQQASACEVEDAAHRANAHEFIMKLPGQYGTLIGERGVHLSGGEQQRLAIARAILASPPILIFDEATSNLDSESEHLVQAALTDLLAGRTAFVIAHRLSTVRRANLILVIDEGRIIEQGNHDELMNARGSYYQMVTRQSDAPNRSLGEVLH